jgi:hypothetical protein
MPGNVASRSDRCDSLLEHEHSAERFLGEPPAVSTSFNARHR